MPALRTWLRLIFAVCFGLVALQGGRAWAATFEVSPVRIPLSDEAPSALLAVRNQSSEPLRFQVKVFTWTQGTTGEMQLAPTQDLIVFPTIFSLKPGEGRNLRIGSAAPAGGAEKTYRVFVEELPPPRAVEPGKIRVLTRMGVPVFLSPKGVAPAPQIGALGVLQDDLSFSLYNRGTGYFLTRRVHVTGVAADGREVFNRDLPAWYVLAGGTRNYTLALPPEACRAARVTVTAETESTSVRSTIELTPRACPR